MIAKNTAHGLLLVAVSLAVSLIGIGSVHAQETPNVFTPESQPILPQNSEVPVGIAVGKLEVTSSPSGARVYVHGKYSGLTPLEIEMASLSYRVEVRMADHKSLEKSVRIDPGKTGKLHFNLERIYPMNPYKKAGHAFLWPGILATTFGFISMGAARLNADEYQHNLDFDAERSARVWTGAMWGSFAVGAAFIVTGIVCWSRSPGDKQYFELHGSSATLRLGERGMMVTF